MKKIDKPVATLLKKGEKKRKESMIQNENVGDFTTLCQYQKLK